MSCVIYKGSKKLLVDPAALNGMLAQGWSLQPQEVKPPSTEEFENFLSMHEELKRISDKALTDRDKAIAELTVQNEQLTEDIEVLEAENIEIRAAMVAALEELKVFKEQAPKVQPEPENPPEEKSEEKSETSSKVVEMDYKKLSVQQLRSHAKRAGIPSYHVLRKADLIEALKNGSQSQN